MINVKYNNRWMILLMVIVCLLGGIYFPFVHYANFHKIGIVHNRLTGEIYLDQTPGIDITPPWVFISNIDTRPQRLCVMSTAKTINCKLVKFNPAYINEFVERQGFKYYWWANRISINMSHAQEYRGIKDILRGYAFSEKEFPFITIIAEQMEENNFNQIK